MGMGDKAVIGAVEAAVESSLGKAAIAAAGRLAEEALVQSGLAARVATKTGSAILPKAEATVVSRMPLNTMSVKMFRVLKEDGRGPYSDFNWATGGHLPKLTEQGWLPGKPLNHMQIPGEADPGIQKLIDRRAGMGDGIYLAANPIKWLDRPTDRVFEAFLRSPEDRSRLAHYADMSGRSIFDDYLLNDFNAGGHVSLVRELSGSELAAYKKLLAK